MKIECHLSALKGIKPHEYAVRFLFGGLITALTGVIAKKYGPGVAGLFLAFPAIFPASATLIEKHEIEEKQRAGFQGTSRGRAVASIDAAGAAIGSLGLIVFAVLIWRFLPPHRSWLVLAIAFVAWSAVSISAWAIRKAI